MRIAPAALLALALSFPGALQAQANAEPTRWSIESVVLGGPGLLPGLGLSYEVLGASRLRLALEAGLLVNVWDDSEYAPCALPPAPCIAPLKPPYAERMRTLALRGDFPISMGWHLVGSTGIVAGDWRRPQGTSAVALDLGLGVTRRSLSGVHSFELRGQRIQTRSYPTYAARIAWRVRI